MRGLARKQVSAVEGRAAELPLTSPIHGAFAHAFYDKCPDFRICDVGEMQFFIKEGDLRARDFTSVQIQMQDG
jgi:hypothetical protein